MIDILIDILEQEASSYNELLSLLQEERKLLSNRRNDELYKLVGMIENLVFKIRGLEDVQNNVVEKLLSSYSVSTVPNNKPKTVNLSQVISLVGMPNQELLKRLQSKLLALVESVKELNSENKIIINRGIENINTTIMFLKDFSAFETYNPSGKMTDLYSRGV